MSEYYGPSNIKFYVYSPKKKKPIWSPTYFQAEDCNVTETKTGQ